MATTSKNEIVFKYVGDLSDILKKQDELQKRLRLLEDPANKLNRSFGRLGEQGVTRFRALGRGIKLLAAEVGGAKGSFLEFASSTVLQLDTISRSVEFLGFGLKAGLVGAVAVAGFELGRYLEGVANKIEPIEKFLKRINRMSPSLKEASDAMKSADDAFTAYQKSVDQASDELQLFGDRNADLPERIDAAKKALLANNAAFRVLPDEIQRAQEAMEKWASTYSHLDEYLEKGGDWLDDFGRKLNFVAKIAGAGPSETEAWGMGDPSELLKAVSIAQNLQTRWESLRARLAALRQEFDSTNTDLQALNEQQRQAEALTESTKNATASYSDRIKATEKAITDLTGTYQALATEQAKSASPAVAVQMALLEVEIARLTLELNAAKTAQTEFTAAKNQDLVTNQGVIASNQAETASIVARTDAIKQESQAKIQAAEAERQRAQAHADAMNVSLQADKQVQQSQESFASWVAGLQANMADVYSGIQQVTDAFTSGVGNAFAQAIVDGQDFGDAMKDLLKSIAAMVIQMIIEIALQQILYWILSSIFYSQSLGQKLAGEIAFGAAAAAASAYAAVPFPANMIAGPIAGAAALAVLTGLGAAGITAGTVLAAGASPFAEGGIAMRPMIATVGEQGPELIAPRSDYEQLIEGVRGDIHIFLDIDGNRAAEAIVPHIPTVVRRKGIKGL